MNIIEAVKGGHAAHQTTVINVAGVDWEVSCDALCLDCDIDGDETLAIIPAGTRLNVSARTQQAIADILCFELLTAEIADAIFEQANVQIKPQTLPISSTAAATLEHSQKIDKALQGVIFKGPQLVSTVGKHWLKMSEQEKQGHPGMAENYGWHVSFANPADKAWNGIAVYPTMTGKNLYNKVIQTPGFCHNPDHVDYSQTCVLCRKRN